MIGVGLGLLAFALAAGDLVAVGRGEGVAAFAGEAVADGVDAAGVDAGAVVGLEVATGVAEPNVIAPAPHICGRFAAFISTSIGIRLGFSGCGGSAISRPFINNFAELASDFA